MPIASSLALGEHCVLCILKALCLKTMPVLTDKMSRMTDIIMATVLMAQRLTEQ